MIKDLNAPCVVCGEFEEIDSGMCEKCFKEGIEEFGRKKKHEI